MPRAKKSFATEVTKDELQLLRALRALAEKSQATFTTELTQSELQVLLALRALDEKSRRTVSLMIGMFARNRARDLGTNVELLASRHFPDV